MMEKKTELSAVNGTILKGKPRKLAARAAETAFGQSALGALAAGGAAFLLAALPLLGGPLPAAACLILCVGLLPREAAALLGACGGYVLLWGWEAAMEPLALALSCFAGALLFRRTPVSRSMLASVLTLAVGGLFLIDAGFSLPALVRLAAGTALALLLPRLWDRAAEGAYAARLGAATLLLLGLAATAPPLGPAAALCGALLLPFLDRLPIRSDRKGEWPLTQAELSPQKGVERALRTMHGVLAREDPIVRPLQLAEVYDYAAEQVCRCCVHHARCWEQQAEDTYRDLCAAGEAIVRRGAAEREDLPPRFAERCCHTAGFLTAVNQALDEQLARRREDFRRVEGRRVAAGQYLALERLLEAMRRTPRPGPLSYAPELAVGSACRAGNSVSGDRGAACRDRFGCYYVLLCDGMGTGPAASGESDRAAHLLTAFLEAGLEADTANGFFVLRSSAAFATLDLLKLDLRSGAGTLYKWGAAPSYLRRGDVVEKIGTATPPPGLEAAQGRVPGQYALSLGEGETLVMVSDGAYGEETARRLSSFTQGSVRDLASCLITLGEADADDDRTAVVVRLRALAS